MGDENSILSGPEARHLLRRATFSPDRKSVARITGKPRGRVADSLTRGKGGTRKHKGNDIQELHDDWVNYILAKRKKLNEKLVLFWHDHFATGDDVVNDVELMARQNQLLRIHSKGNLPNANFVDFVKAINKDAAMMRFLDTIGNTKQAPNENYARELMELFTLGVADLNGNPTYSQEDIVQIARAFTGWEYYRGSNPAGPFGEAYLIMSQHDTGSPKSIFGSPTAWGTMGGFPGPQDITLGGSLPAAQEIDRVVDLLFQHRDSDGMNTVARHIAHKLLTYFAGENPPKAVVDGVVTRSNFDGADGSLGAKAPWNIAALVREILIDDFFYAGAAGVGSVKWPIHYVIETLALCGMKLVKKPVTVNGQKLYRYHILNATGGSQEIFDQLTNMGQRLFEPPSVFGWDWENAWINSGTLLARYDVAVRIARARGSGSGAFRPERLIDKTLTEAADIVDAVTAALAVADRFPTGSPQRTALIDYVTENGTLSPPFDVRDLAFRNEKIHGLFTLVLESPAFQLQ